MANAEAAPETATPGRRELKKEAVRARIIDELVHLASEGVEISHDSVAERAGISRRTVYRYFPDRDSLLEVAWSHLQQVAGGKVRLPRTEADLTETLYEIYTGFDRAAAPLILICSTLQGRAVRLSNKKRRVESYKAAAAEAVKDLPMEDRRLAAAVLQMLHAMPWLELRDQWDMTGEEMARAIRWAISTLLNDLYARKGAPLYGPARKLPRG